MHMQDWEFEVHHAHRCGDGWCFTVSGSRVWNWGPFDSQQRADQVALAVFQKWNLAAQQRGGWAWKSTPARWVITAPASLVVHGRPFRRDAVARHQPPPGEHPGPQDTQSLS